MGPGSGRVGTGRGGPWESVWCWAGSGGLETGGELGLTPLKTRVGSVLRRLYSQIGFAWDQKVSHGFFLAIGRGFGPKTRAKVASWAENFEWYIANGPENL